MTVREKAPATLERPGARHQNPEGPVPHDRNNPGKRRIKVTPETLEGAERERAWQELTSLAPGYGKYLESTDRVIPIVRLRQERIA